jgi:hypothetical protein
MFAQDLHLVLAFTALVAMVVVTGDAVVRTVRGGPPGELASTGSKVLLVLLMMTAAGGLALLVGGHRPKELLHIMYAAVAFGPNPLADSLAARAAPHRKALTRLFAATIALVAVVRLFQTG